MVELPPVDPTLTFALDRLRASHTNGGAFLAMMHVSPRDTFDWFASRNRLLEYGILRQLLSRTEVKNVLPALMIQDAGAWANDGPWCSIANDGDFQMTSPFLFDGQLAQMLYAGGAYSTASGDGRSERMMSLEFCERLFGLRYSEVSFFASYSPWAPWFEGIAWDWTAVLYDRRIRALSILAVTETD